MQYLTSKLSCLLVQTASSTPLRDPDVEVKEEDEKETVKEEDDMDQLFDEMETVGDKPKKKKLIEEVNPRKRVRPSAEGSTEHVALDDEFQEDAIVKLLKSTEKKKKKLAQKKREKKAKSVFHNA